MKVRAKVTCQKIEKSLHWQRDKGFLYTAHFTPVTGGSEEDMQFFEATPAGEIRLGTFKGDYFEPGLDYYVDFTPAR